MTLRLLAILSFAAALQLTQVAATSDKGMGLDPNGGVANAGDRNCYTACVDPNGLSDGGPIMDPNG